MTTAGAGGLFTLLDHLARSSELRIDRPRGSEHPRVSGAVYPVDYGELVATRAGDGAPIDVFVGTSTGSGLAGVALTADLAKRDVEVKLLLDVTDDERDDVLCFLRDVLRIGGHWVPRPH